MLWRHCVDIGAEHRKHWGTEALPSGNRTLSQSKRHGSRSGAAQPRVGSHLQWEELAMRRRLLNVRARDLLPGLNPAYPSLPPPSTTATAAAAAAAAAAILVWSCRGHTSLVGPRPYSSGRAAAILVWSCRGHTSLVVPRPY